MSIMLCVITVFVSVALGVLFGISLWTVVLESRIVEYEFYDEDLGYFDDFEDEDIII